MVHGGTVEEIRPVSTGPYRAAVIRFDRVLRAGDTHSMEVVLDFAYEDPPPPEFQRGVIGGESANIGLRLSFHPSMLPGGVWLAEWPDLESPPIRLGEVELDAGCSAHRFFERVRDRVVGFVWEW